MGKLSFDSFAIFAKFKADLIRMHDIGEYQISDLAELFSILRPTIYQTLARQPAASAPGAATPAH